MGDRIEFSSTPPKGDRRHVLTEDDVRVVLGRLPEELWSMLRRVHFNDDGRGVRSLGYVNRGRREIAICALPPRVSLTRFLVRGQSLRQFGARRGTQWPELAVRRFMLYDTFLHELGHLQIVDDVTKSERLRFARERRAGEFAAEWRRRLWLYPFDHPDPVHNAPDAEELKSLEGS
jgi:hypothetical protein